MKVPMWIRVGAVVFSVSLAGTYLVYGDGWDRYIGDIFPHPNQPPDPRAFDPPDGPRSHMELIPSSKWGEVFTPPLPAPQEFDNRAGEIDTTSPTFIPQSGLPELGLFGPEPVPVIAVPPSVPRIDLSEREFIPSTKSAKPFRTRPSTPERSQ